MDEINGVADGPDVAEAGVGPPDEDDAYDSDEQPDWDNIISLIKKCPTRGGGSAVGLHQSRWPLRLLTFTTRQKTRLNK